MPPLAAFVRARLSDGNWQRVGAIIDQMPAALLRTVAVSAVIEEARANNAKPSLGVKGYERRGKHGEDMEVRILTASPSPDARLVKNSLRGKMRELMADDQWHGVGQITAALQQYVRPEVAIRRFHNHRRRASDEYNTIVFENEPMDVKVALGTLNVIQDTLTDIGCIWRGPKGGLREYRLVGGVQTRRQNEHGKLVEQEGRE